MIRAVFNPSFAPPLGEVPDLTGRTYPRKALISVLREYNRSIGNPQDAIIEQLQTKNCVVTGQQLGFMTGPLYTILKGISCLKEARRLDAIPIYWLATEDHDIHEIDHTFTLDEKGNIKEFHLSFPQAKCSVEDLILTEAHTEEIKRFAAEYKIDLPTLTPSYAHTMASLMAHVFRGTGLVFLEPRLLRPFAKDFFTKELEHSTEITQILRQSAAKFENPPINIGEGPQLFFKDDKKHRIKTKAGETYDYTQLSPNVAARPVLQSLIIPTLAYVAGPSEYEYHQQLTEYFQFHAVPMPQIIPRIHLTLLPGEATEYLEKLDLQPDQPIPKHWYEMMPSLKNEIGLLFQEWEHTATKHFSSDLPKKTMERLIRHALHKLENQIIKHRLRGQQIPRHALHYLRNLLQPHHKPQERVLNWFYFQSLTSENLVHQLLNHDD